MRCVNTYFCSPGAMVIRTTCVRETFSRVCYCGDEGFKTALAEGNQGGWLLGCSQVRLTESCAQPVVCCQSRRFIFSPYLLDFAKGCFSQRRMEFCSKYVSRYYGYFLGTTIVLLFWDLVSSPTAGQPLAINQSKRPF